MGIRGILLAGSALGLVCTGQALAQAAPASSQTATGALQTGAPPASSERARQAAAKGGATVEELVVTARKKLNDLKDQPIAATTFTAEQRNITAVNSIADLVNMTPGVTLSANGMNMRGVGRQTSETSSLGTENPVAYYVNGFPEQVSSNVGESTLYSETVQFERGPVGTRGGKEAMGGAVSLEARHPTKSVEGEALLEYGSENLTSIGANVAGPLTDRYGIRVGWQHFDQSGSYYHNLDPAVHAGGRFKNNYFELQLEGRPTDRFHFWLRTTTFDYTNPAYYYPVASYDTTTPMGALVPNPTFGYTTPPPRGFTNNVDTEGVDRLRDDWVHILNADYDFGPVKLSYVGGYLTYKANGYSDYDNASRASYTACFPSSAVTCGPDTAPFPGVAPGTVIQTRQVAAYDNYDHYFTHELRLENTDKTHVDWVVGGFYYNRDYNEFYEQTEPGEAALATPIASFTTFAPAPPNPDRAFYSQHNVYKTHEAAAFGDIIFHLSERWDLYSGLRYSEDRGVGATQVRYIYFNPAYVLALDVTPGTPSGAGGPSGAVLTYDNKEWTGRVGVDFHPTDQALLYAKYARGFNPSAFNMGNVTSSANNVTAPSTLDAYEVGWKQSFGPTLNTEAAAFYYDYHDLQIPVTAIQQGRTFFAYTNFPKARSFGAEVQATWVPVPALWLNASYSYLNAKTVSFCCAVDLVNGAYSGDLSGRPLPQSPTNKLSLAGAYTWNFAPGSVILGGSAVYRSAANQGPFNDPALNLPSYTLVNLSLTLRSADNHYELQLQASNLFNKYYVTYAQAVANGAGGVTTAPIYGQPRFVGAILRYRW